VRRPQRVNKRNWGDNQSILHFPRAGLWTTWHDEYEQSYGRGCAVGRQTLVGSMGFSAVRPVGMLAASDVSPSQAPPFLLPTPWPSPRGTLAFTLWTQPRLAYKAAATLPMCCLRVE
jgi:hypothetical protein